MTALGYRPHRAARALRTGRSQTIGLVVTTLATVGNSRMLQATAEAAAERGYALTLVTAAHGVAEAFDRLAEQEVDGAIVLNEASALVSAAQRPTGLRLVVVDAPTGAGSPRCTATTRAGPPPPRVDSSASGTPPCTTSPVLPTPSPPSSASEGGARPSPLPASIRPPSVRGDWSADSGYAAGRELASATAVFCANDQMALGLLRAVSESGRRVPEESA